VSTYSLGYSFDELPLIGTDAGLVSGKAFVAIDPMTTDYVIERLFLDDVAIPFEHLLWDVLATRLREVRDEDIRALATEIDLVEDRDVA